MRTIKEIPIGERFHKLRVTGPSWKGKYRTRIYPCICDCGRETKAERHKLLYGEAKSCGCLTFKHGFGRKGRMNKTYSAWNSMKFRCNSPTCSEYHNYGGRGIRVCERWRSSFLHFLEDMGEVPRGLTLDRIDNNGNYEPGNCRWATKTEQQNNRRVCVRITVWGVTKTRSQWAALTGISACGLDVRLKMGWTPEEALTTPPKPTNLHPVPAPFRAITPEILAQLK